MTNTKIVIPSIVGAWRVAVTGVPTPFHMFAFFADGIMLQSNPPAGNKETSDTAGMGTWQQVQDSANHYKAVFEEFRLDIATGVITRGVVNLDLSIKNSGIEGEYRFDVYHVKTGKRIGSSKTGSLDGERVALSGKKGL